MKKLFILFAVFFAALSARADITPEPQIIYEFRYLTQNPLQIVPAFSEQIQCADSLCTDPKPLGSYGIQKLTCTKQECVAVSYDFEPYQKLVVAFSDGKTRQSPVFQTPKTLRGAIQVDVKEDGLAVTALPHAPMADRSDKDYVAVSFIAALLLELLAALIFLNVHKLPVVKVLASVLAANLISIPFGWWALADMLPGAALVWAVTFIFELAFIYTLNRRRLSFGDAAGMVFIMNVASYAIGMAINYMYAIL